MRNRLRVAGVVLLLITCAGCTSQHDREVKAHAEEDYERLHEQLEQERALDAYRRTPEYKARMLKQLNNGMFGNAKANQGVSKP